MTQVISSIQQKGGSGKSTMITSVAGFMAKQRAKMLIIDTDPQQSCVEWAAEEELPNIDVLSHLDEDTFFDVIKAVSPQYDTILVDTAGYDSRMATYAVQAADLILIPCRGSKKDVMGAARTWKHATTLTEKYKDQPEIRIVLWNVNQNTSVFRHAKQALREANLPILAQAVPTLTGFDVMSWNGGLPDGKAASALSSFMAALQIDKLLDFYEADREVA
jgi:chromosome partitioning protein|tara:strand:+ start:549 stop:1205 length:657 start_codon:yes stop_codon:yes gene_type:complete